MLEEDIKKKKRKRKNMILNIVIVVGLLMWFKLTPIGEIAFSSLKKLDVDAEAILQEKYNEEFEVLSSERIADDASVIGGFVYKVKSVKNPDVTFNFYSYAQFDHVGSFVTGRSNHTSDTYLMDLMKKEITNFCKEEGLEVTNTLYSIPFEYDPYYTHIRLIISVDDKEASAEKISTFLENIKEKYKDILEDEITKKRTNTSICFKTVTNESSPYIYPSCIRIFSDYSSEVRDYVDTDISKKAILDQINDYEIRLNKKIEEQKSVID